MSQLKRERCSGLYKAAAAFTEVAGADGKKARCKPFNNDRGVLCFARRCDLTPVFHSGVGVHSASILIVEKGSP